MSLFTVVPKTNKQTGNVNSVDIIPLIELIHLISKHITIAGGGSGVAAADRRRRRHEWSKTPHNNDDDNDQFTHVMSYTFGRCAYDSHHRA